MSDLRGKKCITMLICSRIMHVYGFAHEADQYVSLVSTYIIFMALFNRVCFMFYFEVANEKTAIYSEVSVKLVVMKYAFCFLCT